jgi:hypothetical protein
MFSVSVRDDPSRLIVSSLGSGVMFDCSFWLVLFVVHISMISMGSSEGAASIRLSEISKVSTSAGISAILFGGAGWSRRGCLRTALAAFHARDVATAIAFLAEAGFDSAVRRKRADFAAHSAERRGWKVGIKSGSRSAAR